jgi:hypothetical protein
MMKKIRALDRFFRLPIRFAKPVHARVPGFVLLALVSALLVSGCNLFSSKQLYDDVYYTANFISGIPFSRFVGADSGADPAHPVSGQWDLAYRYQDWDGYNYITLSDSGKLAGDYAAADGLDATAPVYRLEVVNLIDGGNFESSVENWTTTGTATAVQWTTTTPLFGTGCAKVDLETNAAETYLSTAHAGFSGFSATAAYNIFFRYTSATDTAKIIFDEAISENPTKSITLAATGEGVQRDAWYTLNSGYTHAPEIAICPINSSSTLYNFYVDNFRVGRSGNMELRLYLKIADTTPALETGTYSFSVWAYSDPLATTVQNPYPVDAFVVKMVSCAGTVSLSTTSANYAAAAGWQKLTATLDPGALQFTEGTLDPVLGLVLDFNQSRPGSVLLAQPELRFYPDGL